MCTTVPGGNFCLLVRAKINSIPFHPRSVVRSFTCLFAYSSAPGNGSRQESHKTSRKCNCFIRAAADLRSKISHRCHFIWFISDKNVKFEIKCFWTSLSICLVQTCDNIWVYLSLVADAGERDRREEGIPLARTVGDHMKSTETVLWSALQIQV